MPKNAQNFHISSFMTPGPPRCKFMESKTSFMGKTGLRNRLEGVLAAIGWHLGDFRLFFFSKLFFFRIIHSKKKWKFFCKKLNRSAWNFEGVPLFSGPNFWTRNTLVHLLSFIALPGELFSRVSFFFESFTINEKWLVVLATLRDCFVPKKSLILAVNSNVLTTDDGAKAESFNNLYP